ncbi:MAG TPA: endonuclease/exonuclease/phosphatase family protein [Candidatus Saccharimonadales bacterium]|nr:endonuclease/exonuclease/phosphatase family protein [Candidatus Saccharimonadales bacterium]
MAAELKTIQWNIGGGKILADGKDPSILDSYSEDGLDHIIEVIQKEDPDIVTLQEAHQSQPFLIARALGYEGWMNHPMSPSHIDKWEKLALGCISKNYIVSTSVDPLTTPAWQAQWEDGSMVTPHQKAVAHYLVDIDGGEPLAVQNLHLFPFRRFGIDLGSAEAAPVLREVEEKVGNWAAPRIVQGDFNLNNESLKTFLPALFDGGLEEIVQQEPTTPKGSRPDHVLFSGMTAVSSVVIKEVLTDHYPIVTTFGFDMADVIPFINRRRN